MSTPLLTERDGFGELRGLFRQIDDIFRGAERPLLGDASDGWLPAELRDDGESLVLRMDVPGIPERELAIEATQYGVTIRGERKLEVPDGYHVHRRERRATAFTRAFTLPCRIDLEQCHATVKHGVLMLRMAKLPQERPRQVKVSGSDAITTSEKGMLS
jgi:HSP20 family molecular chaperone IbpA